MQQSERLRRATTTTSSSTIRASSNVDGNGDVNDDAVLDRVWEEEAKHINRSLASLSDVVCSLASNSTKGG